MALDGTNFPQELKDLLASGKGYKSYPVLHVTLGDGSTLHYSTLNTTFGGTAYVNRLSKVGNLKESTTQSVDRLPVEIDNGDNLPGQSLNDETRTGAKLLTTYYKIYETLDGSQKWRVERMTGVLRVPKSGDDKVRCEFIADTYAAGAIFGDYEVRRTCVYRYKDPDTCGYAGTLPTCSLTSTGANGCSTHFTSTNPDGSPEWTSHFGGHGLFIDETTAQQQFPDVPVPILPRPGRGGNDGDGRRGGIGGLIPRLPNLIE